LKNSFGLNDALTISKLSIEVACEENSTKKTVLGSIRLVLTKKESYKIQETILDSIDYYEGGIFY